MAAKQAGLSFPSDALRKIPYTITSGQSRNFDLISQSDYAFSSSGKQDLAFLSTQVS